MSETAILSPRKQQIRNVAQNLFRTNGYAATSMRDLAKHVGIEPASLYSHIKSKEEILKGICFDMAAQFFQEIEQIKVLPEHPEKKLKKAIVAHLKVVRHNMDAATVFFHDWRFLNEPSLTQFKSQRKTYEYYFREILEEGIRNGTFKEMNLKVVLPSLFSAMNWTYEWYKSSSNMAPEEVGNEIFEMVFNGMKK